MNTQEIIETEARTVVQTYARPQIVFSHGEGVYLWDTEGKRYLDFTSGIAVTALGHSDPQWVAAVQEQAGKLAHVSNLYHTEPHVALAQRLVDHSFADRVFFCNSGSEANETALKFARKYARVNQQAPGDASPPSDNGDNGQRPALFSKTQFVAFSGGFHGRTMGALSVTARDKYQRPFAPLVPDVVIVPFNDPDAARGAIGPDTCAVIVEPVQGEGGVYPATSAFLETVRAACDQHDALLIFDEVQCGLGRTGTLWAYEAYGVEPDVMTLAKPLAGGLPIGATLVREKIAAVMGVGDHGSTFAAGPLVCQAATVIFDRVSDSAFLWAVQQNAAYLQEQLEALDSERIVAVRGRGLLVGIELDRPVRPVLAAARERGLLIINAGEMVLRLAPPLVVGKEEIDAAAEILAMALEAA